MGKKGLLIVFSVIILLAGGLIAAGQIITSQEQAKPAFTGEYTVGKKDQLAYIIEEQGVQTLVIRSENGDSQRVYKSDEQLKIQSPIFTGDNEITFVSTTGVPPEPPGKQEFQLVHSDVVTVNIENGERTTVLDARGYINDLLYDEVNDRMIVNGVHMSVGKEPEEGFIPYDSGIYTLSWNSEFEKIRSFDAYSPGSLQMTEDGEKIWMILPSDFEAVTPESMYEATERIYEMEINNPATLEVVSQEDSEIPISEFVMFEDETTLLYQTIVNWKEGGNFLYDHVWFDRTTEKEGKRLYLNEAAMDSMLNEEETWLYYVKMSRKADQTNQYDLYRFDLIGEKGEEKVNVEEME